jgi:hypothetical protein
VAKAEAAASAPHGNRESALAANSSAEIAFVVKTEKTRPEAATNE